MSEKFTEVSNGEVLMEGIFQQNLYKWLVSDGKMVVKGRGCEGVRQASSVSIVIVLRGGSVRSRGLILDRIKRFVSFPKR